MSGPDPEILLDRWADGEATAADLATLARLGEADPAVRQRIVRHAVVHHLLGLALAADHGAERSAFTGRITEALVPEAPAFTARVLSALPAGSRPAAIRWWSPLLATAALLLVALSLPVMRPTVGRITGSTATLWNGPPPDGELAAGTHLDLARGLVEIDLDGRGTLLVEGPASLDLCAPQRAVLHRGRVVMHATPLGHGYRLETPDGAVVDLGTRFGVTVADDGATEAHVLEGRIEAFSRNGDHEVLAGSRAVRVGPGGLTGIAADPDAFYTALPPPTAATQLCLHWALDEGSGDLARAEAAGFPGSEADFHLRTGPGGDHPPQWIPGRFGNALAFDGRGSYAESGFQGIAGTGARTVACWVRVPRDFTISDGFAVISWGYRDAISRGAVWQISLNSLAGDGPMGRLRVGTNMGLVVGTTDLRDDAWHHLAVVMYGGERPTIGTHVLLYVDGRLETPSRRTLHPIDTQIRADDHGVWLGRDIMHRPGLRPGAHSYLRGAIDEVVITATALDQAAIQRLTEGRTP